MYNGWLTSLSVYKGKNWLVKRSYEDFRVLDKHLHLCIYDRRFSQLTELPKFDSLKDTLEVLLHTATFCIIIHVPRVGQRKACWSEIYPV